MLIHLPYFMMHDAVSVCDRFAERNDSVLSNKAHRRRERAIESQRLTHNVIQIWEIVQLIHGRIVSGYLG